MLDCACRRLCCGWGDVHCAVSGQNDAIDASAVAATQECAEVARVGDTVDSYQEWSAPGAALYKVGEVGLGKRGGEGNDALGRLATRNGFELAAVDLEQLHPLVTGELHDVTDYFVFVEVGCNPDLAHFAPASDEKFAYGLTALDLLATKGLFGFTNWRLAGSGDASGAACAARTELARAGGGAPAATART
jgi:hypothetical protein